MALELVLTGTPRTKKNSQRIITVGGRPRIIPSKEYKVYESECLRQLMGLPKQTGPANVRCVYYMPTHRRVDLVNLLEATCDILVTAGILEDDNSNVLTGPDGSRVRYDKANPRVEIMIDGGLDDDEIPFYP